MGFFGFFFFFSFLRENIEARERGKELKILPSPSQRSLNCLNAVSHCKIPTFLVEVIHVIFPEEQIGACRGCVFP